MRNIYYYGFFVTSRGKKAMDKQHLRGVVSSQALSSTGDYPNENRKSTLFLDGNHLSLINEDDIRPTL